MKSTVQFSTSRLNRVSKHQYLNNQHNKTKKVNIYKTKDNENKENLQSNNQLLNQVQTKQKDFIVKTIIDKQSSQQSIRSQLIENSKFQKVVYSNQKSKEQTIIDDKLSTYLSFYEQQQLNLEQNVAYFGRQTLDQRTQELRNHFIDFIITISNKRKIVRSGMRAIQYLDYFLMDYNVKVHKEQQFVEIGLCALWMASKVEDVNAYTIDQIVALNNKQIKKDVLLSIEYKLLMRMKQNTYQTLEIDLIQKYVQIFLIKKMKRVSKRIETKIIINCMYYFYAFVREYKVRIISQEQFCQSLLIYTMKKHFKQTEEQVIKIMKWDVQILMKGLELFKEA